MRYILLAIFLLLLVGVGGYIFFSKRNNTPITIPSLSPTIPQKKNIEPVTIIAENVDTPWGLAFLPQGEILFTERPGRVRLIDKNGILDPNPVATLGDVKEIGEGGLLGIAIDPDFSQNNYIYLYYTYDNQNGNTKNRVVRMTYSNEKLHGEKILVDAIPGASNHNGGRIKFGPDGYLYITTGDAQEPSQAQNRKSLAGKILRVTTDGNAAPGNPFGNLVYSYGHRNPQGIAWDKNEALWATEHGRSIPLSGFDEINHIEKGANYGWPDIEGDKKQQGMKTSVANSGAFTTWAPAGAVFVDTALFYAGLKGSALYKATIKNNEIISINEYFKNKYGRIRDVILGSDGMLYISTSNLDGRGNPKEGDDKILRINPKTL